MQTYPADLPDFLIGKSTQVKSGFIHSDPFSGSYKTEHVTRDEFVTWSVNVQCIGEQCEDFEAFVDWMGSRPFKKRIATHIGTFDYVIVITKQPDEPQQKAINLFQYSFNVLAQALKTDNPCVDRELLYRYKPEFRELDIALNVNWPKYED